MTAATEGVNRPAFHTNAHFSPQVMNALVKDFAVKADNMAQEIIASNTSTTYDGPVVIRHYHHYNDPFFWYSPFYTPWYRPSPVIIVPSGNDRRRDRNDDGAAILIGIAAVVIGGVALYAVGSGINRLQDANRELQDVKDFKEQLDFSSRLNPAANQEVVFNAYQVASLKERICTRVNDSAAADLALRIGLFAASATALTGAIMSAPALMTAGVVGGLVIGGGMLFKWGLDSSDSKNFRDAQALHAQVQHLKKL